MSRFGPLLLVLAASSSQAPVSAPPPDAAPTVRGLVNTSGQQFAGAKAFSDGVSVARDAGTAYVSVCAPRALDLGACPVGNALQCVLDAGWYACANDGGWEPIGSGGSVASVGASSPLTSSGGSSPNISCDSASISSGGCLTTGAQEIAGSKNFTGALTTVMALDSGTVLSPLFSSNASDGNLTFKSLVPAGNGAVDFVFNTANTRTYAPSMFSVQNNGTPVLYCDKDGNTYGTTFVTGPSGGFMGPYWYATYPYGNTMVSYRQHGDPSPDWSVTGSRDPSDVTDRTAAAIQVFENSNTTFTVTTSGYVIAGTQWSVAAGHAAYECSGGSGAPCLACADPGTGCYTPIVGSVINGSHHGVLTAGNSTWMDAGWLLELKNPTGPNGQTASGASTDSVFTVDFAGGFGQPNRALQFSQFPPCPDPAPGSGTSGHGSEDSLLNWASDSSKYYVCKAGAGEGYVEIADASRLKSGEVVLDGGTSATLSVTTNPTTCVCGKVTNKSNPVACQLSAGTLTFDGTPDDRVSYVCF